MRPTAAAKSLLLSSLTFAALVSTEPTHAQRGTAAAVEAYRLTALGCTPQPFDGRGVAVCRLTLERSSAAPSPGHGAVLTCEPASTCPFQALSLQGELPAESPVGQSFEREIPLSSPRSRAAGFDWQDGSYRLTARITSPSGRTSTSRSTSFVVKGTEAPKQTALSARRSTPSRTPSGSRAAAATPRQPGLAPLRPDLSITLYIGQGGGPQAEVTNVGSASSPPVHIVYTCKRWCDKNFQVPCTSSPPLATQIGALEPGESAKDFVGGSVIGLPDAGCPLTVQLSATVDPTNLITESDETNNAAHLQFGY